MRFIAKCTLVVFSVIVHLVVISTVTVLGAPTSVIQSRWSVIHFVNEFGERTDKGARSLSVAPIQPMDFPYHNTSAFVVVNCNSV